MIDEHIERALRAGPPGEPSYADVVAQRARIPRRTLTASWSNGRLAGILAAALVLATLAVVGPLRRPSTEPAAIAPLGTIESSGRLRVAITAGPPQVQVPGAGLAGFDSDVANAIATRLGVPAEISFVDPVAIERGAWGGRWDVALDSVASTARRAATLSLGGGYYRRDAAIVVADGFGLTTIAALSERSVCVVPGGLAERWLAGALDLVGGSAEPAPRSVTVLTRFDAAGCLAAVGDGSAAAYVADWRFDIAAVPAGLTEIGTPPFVAIAAVAADPARAEHDAILAEIDRAVADLRADGTIRALAQQRFGGVDLTILPVR
jgi:ABC-type amino acid transport substrate-binding protein